MAALKWPRSFQGRIFLLCFVSTHIPLIALLIWIGVRAELEGTLPILAVATVATLLGTGFAFVALAGMMVPIHRTQTALERYLTVGDMPNLPTNHGDQAGQLMANVQKAVEVIDEQVGRLASAALSDEMTGVRNRRWLNEFGIPMFERHRREGKAFGVLVIDLDQFKQINDNFGHVFGDQVILTAADVIAESVRSEDHVIRVGGDEFAVLMPSAGGEDVAKVARRVREMAARGMTALGADRPITFSVGATSLRPQDRSFLDAYQRADAQLYKAKQNGRDTAVVAP